MNQLIFRKFKRHKSFHLLFILAFTLIFVTLPIAVKSLQHVKSQVETDVSYYSRGSYDLLIRPDNSEMNTIEKAKGIVHENYIGFGEGGISLSQWEDIKKHPDIEIAAPVAALGYFTGVKSNLALEPPDKSTRYSYQFITTDGVNRYNLGDELLCILLESPQTFDSYSEFEFIYNDPSLLNYCNTSYSSTMNATSYHLIVGIDGEEETALTGIDFDFDKTGAGTWAKSTIQNEFNVNVETIPIIELEYESAGSSLELDITIDNLGLDEKDTLNLRKRLHLADTADSDSPFMFLQKFGEPSYSELLEELKLMQEVNRAEISVPIGDYLSAFEQMALMVKSTGEVEELTADGLFYVTTDLNDATNYYLASPLSYEEEASSLIVKKIGYHKNVPVYREIKEKGVIFDHRKMIDEDFRNEIRFITDPIGQIEVPDKEIQLASSPLGIYQFAPVYYVGNGEDDPVRMKSTATPGSFVTPAATGVTTMDAAAAIKGEEPIDAIRIKVAGITEYNKESVMLIEQVAQDMREMGLQVNVIAGASPQKLNVDVEGVGVVEESWTTLGAAGSIISQWNVTNFILTILFAIAAFCYIINRLVFWQVSNNNDLLLLQQIGWNDKEIIKFYRQEVKILLLISLFVALPILLLIELSASIVMIVAGLFILSVFIFSLIISRNIKLVKVKQKTSDWINSSKLKRLPSKNILYFYNHIKSPFFQFIIVSALATFVYLSLAKTVEQTNLTLLGEYINVQTSKLHLLLIIISYVLASFTLVESMISLYKKREKEIDTLLKIGWGIKNIKGLYLKEIAIWSGVSIFLGSLFSGIFYLFLFPLSLTELIIIGSSFLAFYIFIIALSFLVLSKQLIKAN